MKRIDFKIILSVTLLLLCIPIIAMQFTDEVQWELLDFVIAAIIIGALGTIVALLWRKVKNKRYFWLLVLLVGVLFTLLWAELAVGLFNTPFAGS